MLAVGFIGNRLGNLRIGFSQSAGHPVILHNNEILLAEPGMGEFPSTPDLLALSVFRVHIRTMDLHPSLRAPDRSESKFSVEPVRVLRGQHPAPQPLQVRMAHDALN